MVTFEALAEALRSKGSLRENLEALLRYEWLPLEWLPVLPATGLGVDARDMSAARL